MPYIDDDYYKNEYVGIPISDENTFNRLVKRASDIVDMLTFHKLISIDFEKWPDFVQGQVKKATAAQVEYLFTNGETKAMGAGGYGQVSAGNFSYGDKAGADALSREEEMTSAAVIEHLRPTGLFYQGVDVRG